MDLGGASGDSSAESSEKRQPPGFRALKRVRDLQDADPRGGLPPSPRRFIGLLSMSRRRPVAILTSFHLAPATLPLTTSSNRGS